MHTALSELSVGWVDPRVGFGWPVVGPKCVFSVGWVGSWVWNCGYEKMKVVYVIRSVYSCIGFNRLGLLRPLSDCSLNIGSVSVAGNRQSILKDPLPAVAMIGWHVARHWAADDGELAIGFQRGQIFCWATRRIRLHAFVRRWWPKRVSHYRIIIK